jgi:hypothetical protein
VTAFEQGRWDEMPIENVVGARLQAAYAHAISWAQEACTLLTR